MSTAGKDIVLLFQVSSTSGAGLEQKVFTPKELQLKSFPHPKGHGMMIIDVNEEFYELQAVQPRKYSSWFINQRVCSSQMIYMATKLDPRFLCLPFLEKSAGKFSPLDQIIYLEEKYARFPFKRAGEWKMHEMCDVNDKLGDDMILYRYNENKVVEWLKSKVDKTAGVLMSQRLAKAQSQNQAFVSGFNVSKQSVVSAKSTSSGSTATG